MNRSMRIAMFVGTFPVVSETFIVRQIKGLMDLGHEVDLYADTRGELGGPLPSEVAACRLLERTTYMDMPPEAVPWELPIRPLTGRTWRPGASKPVLNCVRALQAVPHALRCFTAHPRLARRVLDRAEYGFQAESLSALFRLSGLARREGRYDVLHAHFGPIGNSFRFARELWQAPLLVSFHGYDFCTLPRLQGAGMYRRLFETADLVTVNSRFTRDRVAALGCPAGKLRQLPVGLDFEKFQFRERSRPERNPIRLITVARLVEIKGHEFALRAVQRLHRRHPDLAYDIVGDGPQRARLEALVAELGLQEVVTLHGARDGSFIEGLLAQAHLAVLASVNIDGDAEGQGLFVQEAQACGLPVVVTQHGALPEGILPGQSGFLVNERDPDALADQLADLIEHSERWPEIGRAGRAFVEARYDIRDLTRQLVELYRLAQGIFRHPQPTGIHAQQPA
jgi:colanic acid/amylovoran biosynthesis glycosyltransferase